MLAITKNNRNPLEDYYRIPDACYSGIPAETKEVLVNSLLAEQGYLCAYCMSRISAENMHIEHWYPQKPSPEPSTDQEKEAHRLRCIDYRNLLAVCTKSWGKSKKLQHCDIRKGNKTLIYNPANPNHQVRLDLRYEKSTGKIRSGDTHFDNELNTVLNLNVEYLQNNRKSVFDKVCKELDKEKNRASKNTLENMLQRYKAKNNQGKFDEYIGVAIYFLEKRLAKM